MSHDSISWLTVAWNEDVPLLSKSFGLLQVQKCDDTIQPLHMGNRFAAQPGGEGITASLHKSKLIQGLYISLSWCLLFLPNAIVLLSKLFDRFFFLFLWRLWPKLLRTTWNINKAYSRFTIEKSGGYGRLGGIIWLQFCSVQFCVRMW